MFDSAIFEVIIGLIFVYSLLAILVTQINMVISNLLNLRARHLKHAVQAMVSDPEIQARLLTHPLIGLVKRPLDPQRPLSAQGAERVTSSSTSDVAWIQPAVFAGVLVDLVRAQAGPDGDLYAPVLRVATTVLEPAERARVQALVRKIQATGEGLDELHAYVAALADPADRQAMLQALSDLERSIQQNGTASGELVKLFAGLRKVQNEEFQRALDTLIETAETLEEAKARLAVWFDKRMDHVTETYRRLIQYISIFVGLALAVLLNVDTLQLARVLWDDPAIRETVFVAADVARDTGVLGGRIDAAQAGLADAQAGLGGAAADPGITGDLESEATPEPGPAQEAEDIVVEVGEDLATTAITVEELLELRLPIGWYYNPVVPTLADPLGFDRLHDTRNLWNYWPAHNPENWLALLLRKVIGIALTTIAVSQGAPFWFDLMNRIARGTRAASEA